jgi:SAM-dependent methyltransferase
VSRSLLSALGPDADGGPTVLEFGAGTAGLTVALLERGATHATGVDLSAASIAAARDRLAAAGLPDGRATFIVGDATDVAVEPHDWVVLDRAICCYGDVDRLIGRALWASAPRPATSIRSAASTRNSLPPDSARRSAGASGCGGWRYSIGPAARDGGVTLITN